jgi:hypothetical protein
VGLGGLSNDAPINVRDWFRAASEHHHAVFGPMVGYLFLFLAIWFAMLVLAQVLIGFLGILFLVPPLAAGPTIVCLAQLRGEKWTFGDFFGGFRRYRTWLGLELLGYLVQGAAMLPALVILIVGWVVLDAAHVDLSRGDSQFLALLLDVLALATAAAVFYLWFRTCLFARQLIVDRGCNAVKALQGNWRLTRERFWELLGVFVLLVGGWALAGVLTCGVAVVLGAPYLLLVLCAGYLHLGGTRPPVSGSTPTTPAAPEALAVGLRRAAGSRLVLALLLGGVLVLGGLNVYPGRVPWKDRGTVLFQFGFPLKSLYYIPFTPARDEDELFEVVERIHQSGCDFPLSYYSGGRRLWFNNGTRFQFSALGLVVDVGALLLLGTPLFLLYRRQKQGHPR